MTVVYERSPVETDQSAVLALGLAKVLSVVQPASSTAKPLVQRDPIVSPFFTQPYWLQEEQPFQEPQRPGAPAGGEIYCDNIWMLLLSSELCRTATKRKRHKLPPPLHLSPEFLSLPPSVLLSTRHRLSSPSTPPTHSFGSPSLPASAVIYLYSRAIMLSHLSSKRMLG